MIEHDEATLQKWINEASDDKTRHFRKSIAFHIRYGIGNCSKLAPTFEFIKADLLEIEKRILGDLSNAQSPIQPRPSDDKDSEVPSPMDCE